MCLCVCARNNSKFSFQLHFSWEEKMLTNLVLSKPHTGASMLEKDQGVQKISPCYLISTNIPEKEGQGTQLVKDKTSGKVC